VHGCCFGGSPYTRSTGSSASLPNFIIQGVNPIFHPQSDGLVERFNRTIEDMLSKAVRRDQRNWDEILPLLMIKSFYQTVTLWVKSRCLGFVNTKNLAYIFKK
jgi:hypothetical protein